MNPKQPNLRAKIKDLAYRTTYVLVHSIANREPEQFEIDRTEKMILKTFEVPARTMTFEEVRNEINVHTPK